MILRRFNKAELVLTQRLHLEKPLLLMVALAAMGYMLGREDVLFFVILAMGIALNAMALSLRSEIALPRLAVVACVLAATGFFILDFSHGLDFFSAMGRYLCLLMACKLLEQKRNRDYAEIIVLAIMMMLDGALVSVRLGYALCLLLFVPLCCYVSMVLTLKIALDRQAALQLSVERTRTDPQTLAWNMSGRFPARTITNQALQATLQCVLAAVVVYLLMPRLEPGALMIWAGFKPQGLSGRTTGVPSSFRLTDLGRITPDPRVVMQVRITDSAGRDLGATGYAAYLRGVVYESYRAAEWQSASESPPTWGLIDKPPANMLIQHITMEPSVSDHVFAIAPTEGASGEADDVQLESWDELLKSKPDDVPVRYVAYSLRPPYSRLQWHELRKAAASQISQATGGAVSPRIAELARLWCQDELAQRAISAYLTALPFSGRSGDLAREIERANEKIAQRLTNKLRESYTYTLDLSEYGPDEDPVEQFLFTVRKGHCEFFASAMTLMARALGLPARMCGGFLADARSYHQATGQYLVRASDAHAWVEIYLPSAGWTVYDPTPPGSANEPPGRIQSWRHLWNNLAFFWRAKVIGYGERERQGMFGRFLKSLSTLMTQAWRQVKETVRAAWEMFGHGIDRHLMLRLLPGLSLVLAGVAVVLLAIELTRRRLRRRRMLVRLQGVPAFYRRLHRLLEKQGISHRLEQTPQEYLSQAARELDLPHPVMRELAEAIYRNRWGQQPLSDEQIRRAEESVGELAKRLKQARKR